MYCTAWIAVVECSYTVVRPAANAGYMKLSCVLNCDLCRIFRSWALLRTATNAVQAHFNENVQQNIDHVRRLTVPVLRKSSLTGLQRLRGRMRMEYLSGHLFMTMLILQNIASNDLAMTMITRLSTYITVYDTSIEYISCNYDLS